jgi:hypothetical protein
MPRGKKNANLDIDNKTYLNVDVDESALPKKKTKGRPKGAKTQNKKKDNSWFGLIKKVKADNPGMSHKEAMSVASKIKNQYGSSSEALGSGISFKGFFQKVGNLGKSAIKGISKVVKSKEFQEVGKTAFDVAKPHLAEAGNEAMRRITKQGPSKSFKDIALSGAKDVGKTLAHEGISRASLQLSSQMPPAAHKTLEAITKHAHSQIDQRVGRGVIARYMQDCDACCAKAHKKGGMTGGFAGMVAALAPTVIPMAANLLSGVFGKLFGKKGKGTPGDYSFNELGRRVGQGVIGEHCGGMYNGMYEGSGVHSVQKSDPPLDNIMAKHSNLWWFIPQPGYMGVTELPSNQFYTPSGGDENLGIWEMANDIDEYINSAPTLEDGLTMIAPTTMTINPTAISGMPRNSSLSSTIKDIHSQETQTGNGMGSRGGFVYAPGMSLSRLANFQSRYGSGIVGSMSLHSAGKGGDISRVGYGVLPTDSIVTGTPVGISSHGRGMPRQQGGMLIKGANVSSWS